MKYKEAEDIVDKKPILAAHSPKISIIIPLYNQQNYVQDAVQSVLNQSLQDIEVLVIDDGSTDHSAAVVRDFFAQDARVRLLSQENMGVSSARNRGIRQAVGEYIGFLDPDDLYPHRQVLAKLYQAALENQAIVCGGSHSELLVNGRINTDFTDKPELFGNSFSEAGFIRFADYQFDYGFQRFIYQREFLIENELWFEPFRRYQDPVWLCQVLAAAESFYAIPDITYSYRLGSAITSPWPLEKVTDFANAMIAELRFAESHTFAKLYNLISLHLLAHITNMLVPTISQQAPEATEQILRIFAELKPAMISAEKKQLIDFFWGLLNQFRNSSEQKNTAIERAELSIRELTHRLDTEKALTVELRESFNYRLGKALLKPVSFFVDKYNFHKNK